MDSYNEENVSTEQDKKKQTIRFQKQDEYKGREKHPQAQKEEGKETPDSGWQWLTRHDMIFFTGRQVDFKKEKGEV